MGKIAVRLHSLRGTVDFPCVCMPSLIYINRFVWTSFNPVHVCLVDSSCPRSILRFILGLRFRLFSTLLSFALPPMHHGPTIDSPQMVHAFATCVGCLGHERGHPLDRRTFRVRVQNRTNILPHRHHYVGYGYCTEWCRDLRDNMRRPTAASGEPANLVVIGSGSDYGIINITIGRRDGCAFSVDTSHLLRFV